MRIAYLIVFLVEKIVDWLNLWPPTDKDLV